MRVRSRVLLVLGIACLSSAVVAGGALAHGGGKVKLGKVSKRGHSALNVEIFGMVSATPDGQIEIDPGNGLAKWSCAVPMGSDVSSIIVGDKVRAKCRSANGVLTFTKLRELKQRMDKSGHKSMHRRAFGRVIVQAKGVVTDITTPDIMTGESLITVQPGPGPAGTATLPAVSCVVTKRTRIYGTPAKDDLVKMSCRSKGDKLVAKKIKERNIKTPGQVQVEVKGIATQPLVPGKLSIGDVTCDVTNEALLAPPLDLTQPVEAKCVGTPLVLIRIHNEV